MSKPKLVIIGATGMVGGEALSAALAHPAVGSVLTLGRQATGRAHPALTERVHADMGDLTGLADALQGATGLLFCLGVYTGAVPDALFRRITVDFAVEAGRALQAASPEATFCLLSGQGADRTERSRAAFARFKGMAENQLAALGLGRFYSFRPGYIYPVEPRAEPNLGYRLSRALWPVMRRLSPALGLPSRDLARAMVHAALAGAGPEPILENSDIQALVARNGLAPGGHLLVAEGPKGMAPVREAVEEYGWALVKATSNRLIARRPDVQGRVP